jgi:hypothetical protein
MLSNLLKACNVKRAWRPSEIAGAKRTDLIGRRLVIHSDSVQELRKSALGTLDSLAGSGAEGHMIALLGPGAAPSDAIILANDTDLLKCTDGALMKSVQSCFTDPLKLGWVCYGDGHAAMVLRIKKKKLGGRGRGNADDGVSECKESDWTPSCDDEDSDTVSVCNDDEEMASDEEGSDSQPGSCIHSDYDMASDDEGWDSQPGSCMESDDESLKARYDSFGEDDHGEGHDEDDHGEGHDEESEGDEDEDHISDESVGSDVYVTQQRTPLEKDDLIEVRRAVLALRVSGIADKCSFDIVEVARKMNAAITKGNEGVRRALQHDTCQDVKDGLEQSEVNLFAGGRTQTRKTLLALLLMMLAFQRRVPVILATHFCKNRNGLHHKLQFYLSEIKENSRDFRNMHMSIHGKGRRRHHAEVIRSFGTFVISDTPLQFDNASEIFNDARKCNSAFPRKGYSTKRLISSRYIIILDESDSMVRSGKTGFEKALASMRRKRVPLVTASISATLIPTLAVFPRRETVTKDHVILTEPRTDYLSLEFYRPLEMLDETGETSPVFLTKDELTVKNNFISPKVLAMWDDAMKNPKSLILNLLTSRVSVKVNMTSIAEKLQQTYTNTAVVVMWGAGMKYRMSLDSEWIRMEGGCTESAAVALVEAEMTVASPIAVFGYSTIFRGASILTSNRVISHIIVNITSGYSMETAFQALGRATGECLRTLRSNGFHRVTVLALPHDYDSCIRHDTFVDEMYSNLQKASNLQEVWMDEYSDNANFLLHQKRSVGPRSRKLDKKMGCTFSGPGGSSHQRLGRHYVVREKVKLLGSNGNAQAAALLKTCKSYMNAEKVSSVAVDDDFLEAAPGHCEMWRHVFRSDDSTTNEVRYVSYYHLLYLPILIAYSLHTSMFNKV